MLRIRPGLCEHRLPRPAKAKSLQATCTGVSLSLSLSLSLYIYIYMHTLSQGMASTLLEPLAIAVCAARAAASAKSLGSYPRVDSANAAAAAEEPSHPTLFSACRNMDERTFSSGAWISRSMSIKRPGPRMQVGKVDPVSFNSGWYTHTCLFLHSTTTRSSSTLPCGRWCSLPVGDIVTPT